jgi:predicted nucleotidyltransferase component of viral defense system
VIARAYLSEWASRAPWSEETQIEQDLLLSRLMVEIASDEVLGPELAMRGGTCLHKLYLDTPLRYSEDLDYVRSTSTGIKPFTQALGEIADRLGLTVSNRQRSGQMVHVYFDAEPTAGVGRIRIKIEMNIAEIESFLPRITHPYIVESRWWSGQAEVPTFEIDELMSTKLRALYQRRKGRDLFDLWLGLTVLDADPDRIVAGFEHYMREAAFSYPELRENLAAKLGAPGFEHDLDTLVASMPGDYTFSRAADLVMRELGSRLRNAPPVEEIEDGRWRASIEP